MAEFVVEMRGVTKHYRGVAALEAVDFALRPGEVHGLVGGHGAGKSTLMKILCGAESMDSGEILILEYPARIASPLDALDLGVNMVCQESHLVPRLSVAENIFLGRAPRRGHRGPISWRRMRADAREVLDRVGMDLDTRQPAGNLAPAQQLMVEVAKALSLDPRVLVLDEPAARLAEPELDALFKLMKLLRRGGMGVVYITHRLEELFPVAQRVTVLHDGKAISTHNMFDVTRDDLTDMMSGRGAPENPAVEEPDIMAGIGDNAP